MSIVRGDRIISLFRGGWRLYTAKGGGAGEGRRGTCRQVKEHGGGDDSLQHLPEDHAEAVWVQQVEWDAPRAFLTPQQTRHSRHWPVAHNEEESIVIKLRWCAI